MKPPYDKDKLTGDKMVWITKLDHKSNETFIDYGDFRTIHNLPNKIIVRQSIWVLLFSILAISGVAFLICYLIDKYFFQPADISVWTKYTVFLIISIVSANSIYGLIKKRKKLFKPLIFDFDGFVYDSKKTKWKDVKYMYYVTYIRRGGSAPYEELKIRTKNRDTILVHLIGYTRWSDILANLFYIYKKRSDVLDNPDKQPSNGRPVKSMA